MVRMVRTLFGLAAVCAVPTLVAAQTPQIPNEHASDQGKAMVALHSQGAVHRAKHRRGDVIQVDVTRNPNAATPATRATPAVPGHGDVPTLPAHRATPATPAHKQGQATNPHRP